MTQRADFGHAAANAAIAQHAQVAIQQLSAQQVAAIHRFITAHHAVTGHNALTNGHHQRHGMLGGGFGRRIRRVDDQDAARGGGRNVYTIYPDAGPRNHLQVGTKTVHYLTITLAAAQHQGISAHGFTGQRGVNHYIGHFLNALQRAQTQPKLHCNFWFHLNHLSIAKCLSVPSLGASRRYRAWLHPQPNVRTGFMMENKKIVLSIT